MATTVMIRDETASGDTLQEWALEVLTERITVRELIRSRVYQEVQDHNRKGGEVYRGLVQPEGAEAALNGVKLKTPRQIDWKAQFKKATDAFKAGQILILRGDRQADSLDEEIELQPGTVVSFLKLTLLVG